MKKVVETDVLIIGAGAAGIAAAVAADRLGEKVVLVEKAAMLGGQASLAQVGTICGVHARESYSTNLAGEFANSFLQELFAFNSNSFMQQHINGLGYVPYGFRDFAEVSSRLLSQTKVQLHLHSTVFGVSHIGSVIKAISFISGADLTEVRCSTIIDATGEGLVTKLAEKPAVKDECYQAPAYVFRISDLEVGDVISERDLNLVLLKAAHEFEKDSLIQSGMGRLSVVPGSLMNKSVSLKFAFPIVRTEGYNELTTLELLARSSINKIFLLLKSNVAIFYKSEISMLAPQVGLRSASRSRGVLSLKLEDVLNCKKAEDGVANGFWPVEFWDGSNKPIMKFFAAADHYQIPAGCLMSADFHNLFICGRGISADQEALSSARVIGTCFQTGTASAYLAQAYLRNIERNDVIKKLRLEEKLG